MKSLSALPMLALAAWAFAAPAQAGLPTGSDLAGVSAAAPGLPTIETAKRKADSQAAPKRKGKSAARKKGK